MFRISLALTTAAIALSAPALAKDASCEITISGQRIDGACDFQARKGGSFDITMTDGRSFAGAQQLSLDVLRKGQGEIRSDAHNHGTANRSSSDPACWVGDAITVCVRAAGERRPGSDEVTTAGTSADAKFIHPSSLPLVIRGRCHMDGCWWVRVESVEQIGSGSARIPGTRLRVRMSHMSAHLQTDGPDYADLATPDSDLWGGTSYSQFFCSMRRPAFLDDENGWITLNPARIGGASEGITNIYLTLCHANAYQDGDPYEGGKALGYAGDGYGGDGYKTFSQLTTP